MNDTTESPGTPGPTIWECRFSSSDAASPECSGTTTTVPLPPPTTTATTTVAVSPQPELPVTGAETYVLFGLGFFYLAMGTLAVLLRRSNR